MAESNSTAKYIQDLKLAVTDISNLVDEFGQAASIALMGAEKAKGMRSIPPEGIFSCNLLGLEDAFLIIREKIGSVQGCIECTMNEVLHSLEELEEATKADG